jgi:hypothetical protein
MLLVEYFLWCWFGKNKEVNDADCVRELDDLERQFRNYKEMKRKKAEANATKRLRSSNKYLYQNL